MAKPNTIEEVICEKLSSYLHKNTPKHPISEVYYYSLFPTGKLFRPRLLLAIAQDLYTEYTEDDLLMSCFVELHHGYTLIHDDLPSLDNDDIRRGKPSVHKRYGEWRAILAGDALLSLSYGIIADLQSSNIKTILKLCTQLLGPKGLIHGQIIDMTQEGQASMDSILQIHRLKTSRLMQICTVSPILLRKKNILGRQTRDFYKLGDCIGIIFQLVDDLLELTQQKLGEHELNINPYLKFDRRAIQSLDLYCSRLNQLLEKYPLEKTNYLLKTYLRDCHHHLGQNDTKAHPKLKAIQSQVNFIFDKLL